EYYCQSYDSKLSGHVF
nr:immunoglobulin light chain junction region [Macaca mulatta]